MSVAAVSVCLTLTFSSNNAIAEESGFDSKEVNASDVTEFYDSVIEQPIWSNTVSRIERGEMVQLPENMLSELSTEDLIEAVLDYPFFIDVYAFNDVQTAIDIMYDSFNGLRELASRSDLVPVLIEKYRAEPVAEKNSDDDVFRLDNIEILLVQDFVTEQLSSNDIAELSKLISDKHDEKIRSGAYGSFSTNLIFDLLEINAESDNLAKETQKALYSET